MHQPSPHNSPHMRAQPNPNNNNNNNANMGGGLGNNNQQGGNNNATQHIENLCNKVFGQSTPQEKQMAQAELNKLQTSTDNIPLCQQVLASSQNPYALVAAVSLDGRSLKDVKVVKVIPSSLSQHGQLG